MFAKSITTALVAVAGFAAHTAFAQEATPLQLAGVKANFEQAQLVPQFLPTFDPTALLNVSFSGETVLPGTPLAATAVSSMPTLTVVAGDNFTTEDTSMYTVAMVDADVVGTDASGNQTRHWLANNVMLTDDENDVYGLNYTTDPITNYAGPGPFEGSGAHRYVLMLISQPSTFTAPADLSQPNTPLGTFNFQNYLSSTGLGPVVAANYITVENGVATSSVASTSAVQSSTLAVAATVASSSSMASSSSAMTSSAAAAASSSASRATSAAGSAASSAAPAASSSTSGALALLPAGLAGMLGAGALVAGLVL